ncbi:hypothetical protein DL96DRAFT_1049914 [Flagelloscypha sp. PMI_526]|nr:hypothetical protein DL96DRAFT_1049914 [Flagelloscypha sp. PMI_526]
MSNLSAKERFLESFRELSQEEKLVLVEEHLAQLLDDVSVNRASEGSCQQSSMLRLLPKASPHLDLDTRKAEYESLFSEIEQDAKSYTSKDRSKRLEIIDELVSSLGKDVNEIWQIVFEYRRQFSEAHRCLLYLLQVTERIWDLPLLREQAMSM